MSGFVKRARGAVGIVLINVTLIVLLLAVLEGLASFVLVGDAVREIPKPEAMAERSHARYDTLLGWSHEPGAHVPDLYGPGIDMLVDDRGFRHDPERPDTSAATAERLVCLGDSFTLGYGVRASETWCSRLEAETGLRTVNMGQGGYGVDQAYLWYQRDGTFPHDVVLFAVIADDFSRLRSPLFLGYDKPVLVLDGDSFAPGNVPVPSTSFERGPQGVGTGRLLNGASDLALVDLGRRVLGKLGMWTPPRSRLADPTPEEELLSRRLFRTLAATAEERGARMIAVFLPTEWDYRNETSDAWRALMAEEASSGSFEFWDLTEDLRSEHPIEVKKLFIHDGAWVGAEGHYTVAGNEWVTGLLRGRLEETVISGA